MISPDARSSEDAQEGLLRRRYNTHSADLTRVERRVAEHLLTLSPADLPFASAEDLARAVGASDATVIRTARRLGFSGLADLKRQSARAAEAGQRYDRKLESRLAPLSTDIAKLQSEVFASARDVLDSTQAALDLAALDRAIGLIEAADQIWCAGQGVAEQPARHLATSLLRAGLRSRVCAASAEGLVNEIIGLRSGDCLVIFGSAAPRRDVLCLIGHARSIGASLLMIADTQIHRTFGAQVDAALLAPSSAARLASWIVGAMVMADLLTASISVRNRERTLHMTRRLLQLRDEVG